jgi:hypothetical protein
MSNSEDLGVFDDNLSPTINEALANTLYNKNDVTIILQGELNNVNLLASLNEYQNYAKTIIVSSYFIDNIELKNNILDNFPEIILIDNDINEFMSQPEIIDYKNERCFFQVSTVRKALKYVNTPYIIKTRVDNYFSNLDKFICEVINNKNKITCIDIYVRGFYHFKYHPSDILFGGSYENLTNVFNNKHNFDTYIPEIIIFKNYILRKLKDLNIDVNEFENNIDLYGDTMDQIFNIYNISNFEIYYFKNATFKISNKSTKDFFKSGCDNL